MNKKLTAILTLVCFLFTMMPMAAFAEAEDAAPYMKPSAESGTYDADTNTLTMTAGGTVTFESNIALDAVEGIKQAADDGEETDATVIIKATSSSALIWIADVPNESAAYYFTGFYTVDNSTELVDCWVDVIVNSEPTGYTLTLDYSIVTESGVEIGAGLSDQSVGCPAGDVVDLSYYWRDESLEVTGSDGEAYYFGGFVENSDGNGTLVYSVTMNKDKTLYANWVFDKQITVILDTQGGTLPYRKIRIAEKYAEISEMNSLHKPVRAGYDFVGWSVENDGIADSGETHISDGWPIYAVWQQYSPSYDDDYYNPPPASIPVDVGGNYDAILRDDVVIVRGDEPISGTLDLGKTDAVAIRLPADAVKASAGEGHAVTIKYPSGTAATMTDSAWVAALRELRGGEDLQIAVKKVGAEVLPDSLTTPPTNDGPYGGSEFTIGTSIFSAAGIENIEDRLKTFGLINGNTDTSITEEEFEYLYHYLTTDELMVLRTKLNKLTEGGHDHNEYLRKAVDWLTKMIERDATVVEMSNGQLNISGILSKLEAIGYTGGDFTLGFLRQADLDMKHLEYIRHLMQEFVDNFDDSADELVLAWANEAIAQKELEKENATITSMTLNGLEEYADLTDKQMQILSDMGLQNLDNPSIGQIKKLGLTLEQMELLYAEIDRARSAEYDPAYRAEYGVLLNWLKEAISEKEQENKDAPIYINIGGEKTALVAALEVDVKSVKVSGSTRNIEILADRSDAFAWSTNISSAALEEMLAMLGDATTEDVVSNIKAYKVLDNGTLEAKASKVTVNADGTLTLSAMSDGNSVYVFVLEPTNTKIVLNIGSRYVTVNGDTFQNDVAPQIVNNRTVLPIRVVAENLGADVDWDAETQKVTITKDDTVIELFIGKYAALVNGEPVQLDAAPFIDGSRTYLPVRFVSEYLGAIVDWDADTRTVTILGNK